MTDYEKLVILLESQGVDIQKLIDLKKNEFLLLGSRELTEEVSFENLVKEKNNFLNPMYSSDNPFFMGLGVKKYPTNIGDIEIYHYKEKNTVQIKEIMENEEKFASEKQDVIYHGFQKLTNEYKLVLDSIASKDFEVLQLHRKIEDANTYKLDEKWLKKYNLLFWFISILMIIFIDYLLQDIRIGKIYITLFNIIFNILVIFPFLKIIYARFLIMYQGINKKNIKLKNAYQAVFDLNDKSVENFEKDLYGFYNNISTELDVKYLLKTNKKFIKSRKYFYKLMKRKRTSLYKYISKKVIFYINIFTPILIVLLFIYIILTI